MSRLLPIVSIIAIAFFILACSGTNPASPDITLDQQIADIPAGHFTGLWGYYSILIHPDSLEVECTTSRTAMYAVNVNAILNNNPATLEFAFNSINATSGYIDVDLDVTVHHPIPANSKFHGYDVRGIMIGDGSGVSETNPSIRYAVNGVDQYVMNADGYTRWFNKNEFFSQGLFGFTPGLFGVLALEGTATINGYKYFADGLGADDDAWTYLESNPGIFTSGSTNTRRYEIRFPIPSPGLKYDYAIIADWSGGAPEHHPSPAPEAILCDVEYNEIPYYSLTAGGGGDLSFDMGLMSFDDDAVLSTMVVESDITAAPVIFDMQSQEPWDVGDNYFVWHIEFPADEVLTSAGNEMLIELDYSNLGYENPGGIPNGTGDDPLSAFFRFDIPVFHGIPVNNPPVITDGVFGPEEVNPDQFAGYIVVAVDPENDPLEYWWTITDTSDQSIAYEGAVDGGALMLVWGDDFVVEPGDVFEIDCDVSDSCNPPVSADTLQVSIQ